MAVNNPPTVSEGHAELELNRTGFRGNKENKEIVSNVHKCMVDSKFRFNLELQTSGEIARCKNGSEHLKMSPSVS